MCMEEIYLKSMEVLVNLEEKPTPKEWNKIAKKQNLLNIVSIRFIGKQKGDNVSGLFVMPKKKRKKK